MIKTLEEPYLVYIPTFSTLSPESFSRPFYRFLRSSTHLGNYLKSTLTEQEEEEKEALVLRSIRSTSPAYSSAHDGSEGDVPEPEL